MSVISGGLTLSFTTKEEEQMGAKITIFCLVSCVVAVHSIRTVMVLLKKADTDRASTRGVDLRAFFEIVSNEVIEVNSGVGGTAFNSI
jgi:hypothetical protein